MQFLAGLRAAPPRFVIVASGDAWPGIGNLDSAASFERFVELRDFVATRYERVSLLEARLRYAIYRRRD
jgi:hypothetical protein